MSSSISIFIVATERIGHIKWRTDFKVAPVFIILFAYSQTILSYVRDLTPYWAVLSCKMSMTSNYLGGGKGIGKCTLMSNVTLPTSETSSL